MFAYEVDDYNNMVYNLIIHLVIGVGCALQLQSNYNYSLVQEQALLSEPLLLAQRNPLPMQRPPLIEHFPLRKYELRDTGYHIDDSKLSQVDHHLLYQMEPPPGLFAFEVLSVENYHLLEIRQFQVALANPSPKFTLCLNEIVIDSEEVRRNDDRGVLPHCLPPGQQQVFNFSLYVASAQPTFVRVTVYFLVEIMQGRQVVEEKAYARKVYATVTQNHLHLETTYFKNCPASQTITLHNYEANDLALRLESRKRVQTVNGESLEGDIKLRAAKEVQLHMEGKATQLIIHSIASDGRLLPSLLLKTHCEEALTIDYCNIGILTDERMVIDVPLTLSTRTSDNLTLLEASLQASSQTVELEKRQQLLPTLPPFSKNLPIAMMRIHFSRLPERRSTITVRVRYEHNGEERVAVQRFVYMEIRNAVSAGQRKFIDVTKYAGGRVQSRFPIKNNLNVPIYLNRITVDESIFQLSWQSDRRRLIYPNHSSEQFSLIYTGSLSLPLSSLKYLALLEFNGHILVPLQITIYDHTLQCLYNNIVHKCAALPPLDFGYFRDASPKSKQLVVRNWNPEGKMVQLAINQTQALLNGYNASLRVYRPGIQGDHQVRQSKSPLELMLKSHQFLLLNIEVQPFDNATSNQLTLMIATASEVVNADLLMRTENGTIALIPQVLRFTNAISKQIQYINLVSTYSQQYSIREVSTNLTGLSVHYNQPPTILGNQWVGMSVVYDPLVHQNLTLTAWTPSFLQYQYLHHRQAQDFSRITFAKIRLTTTTDLDTNSTVIIEENFPQLLPEAEISAEMEGVYEIKKIMLKRKRKSVKKEQRHSGEIKLSLTNSLDVPLKYSLFILSEPKIKNIAKTLKNYELYNSVELEDGYVCVSEDLRARWGITAATIKSIFRLQKLPEECYIEKNNAQAFVINSQKQKVAVNSNLTMIYLAKSLRNDCRICYRFTHRHYIHRLINTEFVNKVLEEEGLNFLAEFVKAELNHLEDLQIFELEYLDLHSRIKEDFGKFCETFPDVMMFRFCHYLNVRLASLTDHTRSRLPLDKPIQLPPHQTHTATLAVAYPPGRERLQFFLVAANNATRFETYRISVLLQEPSLRVEPTLTPFEIEAGFAEEAWSQRRAAELPVLLNRGDYREEEGVIAGARTFELVNEGEIDVEVAHVGIEEKEVACVFGDIWLNGLTCPQNQLRGSDWAARAPRQPTYINRSQQAQSFIIAARSSRNLTINFQFMLPRERVLRTPYFPLYPSEFFYAIYLYDSKGYYFKLTASFKVGDRELRSSLEQLEMKGMRQPLVSYHSLNIISLLLICLILVRVRREEGGVKKRQGHEQGDSEHYNKLYRMKKLSKIIRESSYSDTDSSIGARLLKRAPEKPVHCISEDLLLSVREVKHRQLKKYFNESQQSEIGGLVGYNHHLSLSHSMSYDQEEHDNNQQPIELITLPDSPHITQEEEESLSVHPHPSAAGQGEQSQTPSSQLPEGEQVKLIDELDADSSWFDFNQENSLLASKSASNVLSSDNEFYNVFRSEIRLKKEPDNNYARYQHHKRD